MSILPLALGLALAAGPAQDAPSVEVLDHAGLTGRLQTLAREHARLATLSEYGESREGHELHALRITAVEEPGQHPALLLVANLEGPRVFESGVALQHAEQLLAGYETSEDVKALLDSTVLWIVPRANPDPAEAYFASPRHERWTGSTGIDNDRDGRTGEDPPVDLNGDGLVTHLRVLDPEGTWMEDANDPRALVEADPDRGQRGRWKLYTEARDADGDDRVGEDPAADTRMDKNFAAGWVEHTPASGAFPTDEPEARALCEFVMAQKNLVLVVTYDGRDNLVEKPDSVKDDARPKMRIPPAGLLASDAARIEELGKRYREATENEATGSEDDGGTFARWCYEHRGLFVLEAALWNLPTKAPPVEEVADEASSEEDEGTDAPAEPSERPKDPPSDDAGTLAWIDATEGEAWRFVDWTPFEHPELGPVEIGGFTPYARLVPPTSEWDAIADAHFGWFVGLGEHAARLELSSCTRRDVGDALWEVEAVLTNEGYLPLLSRSMRRTRTTRPARVRLTLPEGAQLLAGERQTLVRELDGSGGRRELKWLVLTQKGEDLAVVVDSDHAGSAQATPEVIR